MNAKRKCKTHKFQKLDKTLLNYRKPMRSLTKKVRELSSRNEKHSIQEMVLC